MQIIKKVLVLYVGGTIGMEKDQNDAYSPSPNRLFEFVKGNHQMHDPDWARKHKIPLKYNELIVPHAGDNIVMYEVREYEDLLDSSNMSAKDWIRIAQDIERNYNLFNGFVVLHGTDTLAYTASALSFMLDGIQKPVILTGSQIPIFETCTDAKNNMLLSLILAGSYDIPEVCIFFAKKLLRGNRTTKVSSTHLDAFDSPDYHPLAEVDADITVSKHIWKASHTNLIVHTNLNCNVGLLSFFPTITPSMLKAMLQEPMDGLVLLSYGVGNIPSREEALVELLKEAVDRGTVIVNVTQCSQGRVSNTYETGKVLEDMGIIFGNDMTAEAALTKLCYVLGIPGLSSSERTKLMKENLRGEMTRVA